MPVEYENLDNLFKFLRDLKYDIDNLLYRVFVTKNTEERVKEILIRGTDRTIDTYIGNEKDGIYNLESTYDDRLEERGRPLMSSEYLWLTTRQGLREEVRDMDMSNGTLFVSVYDPNKVTLFTSTSTSAYEILDKGKPQEALVILIENLYQN